MATIIKQQVDLNQGQDKQGRDFGYVAGEGGGFFFSWCDTLDETLDTVACDEVDGDGGLDRSEVVELLRDFLPTTEHGEKMWGN